MASLASWLRIESSTRSSSGVEALRARTADPLWLLFRQWQFGEFQGEDAGSPIRVRVSRRETAPTHRVVGSNRSALEPGVPRELQLFAEDRQDDVRSQIELAGELRRLLAAAGEPSAFAVLRTAYPLGSPSDAAAALFLAGVDDDEKMDCFAL